MTPRTTDSLIERLAAELTPVRRSAPLRYPAFGLVAGWTLAAGLLAIWPGAPAIFAPSFLPVFLACAVFAMGGLCTALALCVPGREAAERFGHALCGVGLVGIAGLAASGSEAFPSASVTYLANPDIRDWTCVGLATVFALPFLALVVVFGRGAWVLRHWAVSAYAGIGSVSCGAMLVHAICAEQCAQHALGSHALAPLWGAPLLLVPAYLTLRERGFGRRAS